MHVGTHLERGGMHVGKKGDDWPKAECSTPHMRAPHPRNRGVLLVEKQQKDPRATQMGQIRVATAAQTSKCTYLCTTRFLNPT